MTDESRLPGNDLSSADVHWMREALLLAEETIGLASPNPVVGCVLVRGEQAVGRGAHIYDRLDHAEIVALKQAGEEARGAVAYVTLEPCSHTGRTGPCAEALVRAGVARVVVATGDPNPLVSGRGIARLREAGIAVTVGALAGQARELNDGFARFIRSGLPFVTLKAGLSLDGRIAPSGSSGATAYLTSPQSLSMVQRMRHASDAILTGIGTVLEDNPLLTDRSSLPRRRPLLRVVLDSALRLPLDSRLVTSAQGDLLIYTTDASSPQAEALRRAGVIVEREELVEGTVRLDVRAVIASLGKRHSIVNLLAEGGSRLNRSLIEEHLVDKLCLFYAPLFLGDDGVPLVAGPGGVRAEMPGITLSRFGPDFRFEAYLRDPWE